ncbi:uncharacterized protein LOC101457967 [Ceratitis capitata]|uniref:uncharacterized protein LOC101457967 n=1 Tax=Ceratitis capitata TaxID=7213 RepID=UPI000A11362B|nr:uncharacterized protein LOC101457967 [Ceratitis capitata]
MAVQSAPRTSLQQNVSKERNYKYVKRPPRKAYGRLSADSDGDSSQQKHKIDDPFDEFDNFKIITSGSGCSNRNSNSNSNNNANGNGNGNINGNGIGTCPHGHADARDGGGGCAGGGGEVDGKAVANGSMIPCTLPDCQGNFINGGVCHLDDATGLCTAVGMGVGVGVGSGASKSNSSAMQRQKEVNENTINRLQAMAMSDDDDYDESLTCNVCDRAFHCHRQLASHQQKKRHFGCNACDSLFPSLMILEHHKEEFEHWSDDEVSRRACCRRNRGDDYFTDTDSFTSEAESEDLERLL